MFQISNLLLAADITAQVANNSAVGMIGSFIAAALLILIPATAFLIFVSVHKNIVYECIQCNSSRNFTVV